jgi:hypothetical protein
LQRVKHFKVTAAAGTAGKPQTDGAGDGQRVNGAGQARQTERGNGDSPGHGRAERARAAGGQREKVIRRREGGVAQGRAARQTSPI